MDKHLLSDYIDICELIRETEDEIQSLNKKEIVHDKVTGSNPEFPYQPKGFHISGINEISLEGQKLKKEISLLEERKRHAEKLKAEIDKWMKNIPARMQRIVRMKYFERMTWDEVACKISENTSGETIRKEFYRFLIKK